MELSDIYSLIRHYVIDKKYIDNSNSAITIFLYNLHVTYKIE